MFCDTQAHNARGILNDFYKNVNFFVKVCNSSYNLCNEKVAERPVARDFTAHVFIFLIKSSQCIRLKIANFGTEIILKYRHDDQKHVINHHVLPPKNALKSWTRKANPDSALTLKANHKTLLL